MLVRRFGGDSRKDALYVDLVLSFCFGFRCAFALVVFVSARITMSPID